MTHNKILYVLCNQEDLLELAQAESFGLLQT